ncbi:MAG: UDP-N-acetylmuramoyl-L-alanyl-D-glutamate--2,6-diaminopimelate ligase [Bacteroidales bacterium]|jgi:UDP-N-acetylmuramoyl-L-alanyl-D-glutamate--2,6-diaminopimelate ligase|nr:UDP-N-acetylmuramoyl-L-alanyl-D-glutamate--2,6-diaminopimelate ligase [Bacteroidales bacterium]
MMAVLSDILKDVEHRLVRGEAGVSIRGIQFDSRRVQAGDVFVAVSGTHVDGRRFIGQAVDSGAVAVITDDVAALDALPSAVAVVQTEAPGRKLGLMAANFYGHPSDALTVVGVTGTNGKTTVATVLYRLFTRLGMKCGLLSTVRYMVGEREFPATHTTPDPVRLQELMAMMVSEGCQYCFMEVSSHAVDQDRIAGIRFAAGIFTNITHDHLDYHKTFAEYLKAKKKFFDNLSPDSYAITNVDDKNGMVMLQNTRATRVTYALRTMADFKCRVIEKHIDGMELDVNGSDVWTHFSGVFNAYNLTAVYAAAVRLGADSYAVLLHLSELHPVDGRFEIIRSPDGKFAIVDYAHTPDALKNVLQSIDEVRADSAKIIAVVGAGGDRDKSKRPEMATEAASRCDHLILTSDNPRSEEPEQIITDMEAGLSVAQKQRTLAVCSRREAIKTACMLAKPGDIILIAGKGHENYQEIKGVKHHFDDRETVREIFGINATN